jgi:hypothetical protein
MSYDKWHDKPQAEAIAYHNGFHCGYEAGKAFSLSEDGQPPKAIGFFVWTEKFGYAFKNKLHETREAAEGALASVVWHNRHNFEVRPVYLGDGK